MKKSIFCLRVIGVNPSLGFPIISSTSALSDFVFLEAEAAETEAYQIGMLSEVECSSNSLGGVGGLSPIRSANGTTALDINASIKI